MPIKFFLRLLLIVLVIISCQTDKSIDTSQLFQQYFEIYPSPDSPTATGFAAQSLREQAFKLYHQQNYTQAAVLFEELVARTQDTGYQFYWAICLLAQQKAQEALPILKAIPEGSNFKDPSAWYLALAHLQVDDPVEARTILKNLSDDYNKAKRTQLLRAL